MSKTLEQLQHEADAANKALHEAKQAIAVKARNEAAKSLSDAIALYKALSEDDRKALQQETVFLDAIRAIGKRSGGGKGKGGGKYDEAKLMAYIGEGTLQSDVQKHFGVSKPAIGTWGKKLEAKKLIKIGKDEADKTSNFWRKI